MGMYTEINMRANLKKDTPEQVLQVLECMTGRALPDVELPFHPFFGSHRWDLLSRHASYYFPRAGRSELVRPEHEWETATVAIHGNLKNYENEIAQFFHWLDPYIEADPGEFLGYSLYEEDQYAGGAGPSLWRKGQAVSVA